MTLADQDRYPKIRSTDWVCRWSMKELLSGLHLNRL